MGAGEPDRGVPHHGGEEEPDQGRRVLALHDHDHDQQKVRDQEGDDAAAHHLLRAADLLDAEGGDTDHSKAESGGAQRHDIDR